jgi:hypothetical protein
MCAMCWCALSPILGDPYIGGVMTERRRQVGPNSCMILSAGIDNKASHSPHDEHGHGGDSGHGHGDHDTAFLLQNVRCAT